MFDNFFFAIAFVEWHAFLWKIWDEKPHKISKNNFVSDAWPHYVYGVPIEYVNSIDDSIESTSTHNC